MSVEKIQLHSDNMLKILTSDTDLASEDAIKIVAYVSAMVINHISDEEEIANNTIGFFDLVQVILSRKLVSR